MGSFRILAVDYGEKRIGLALSDLMHMFAKPYKTIPNESIEKTIQFIQEVIQEKEVGQLVLGIPWGLDGLSTDKTRETQAFFDVLKTNISIPVVGFDERFTTTDAHELLKEMGYSWKEAKKIIDSMAACLILKKYLEENKKDA